MPRRPDVPCAACGRLIWRGSTSRPQGEAKCQPCRRERAGYRDKRVPLAPVQYWSCTGCRGQFERSTVRGVLPKWCRDCQPKRTSIRPSVRRAVYERDGWKCGICTDPVDASLIGSRSIWRPSLDHVVPYTDGGTDEPHNLRLAHFWCNSVRGADLYEDEVFRVA